jgi:hypothetical protein
MLIKFLIICVLSFGGVENRPQENPCAGIDSLSHYKSGALKERYTTKNILDLRNKDTFVKFQHLS